MPCSGILLRATLIRTDVSEERSVFIVRVTRISELGTTLAVTSGVRQLLVTVNVVPSTPILATMKEALRFSETSVLTIITRRYIAEDGILHSLLCLYSLRQHWPKAIGHFC
jgi:hypothetical protein